MNLQRIKIERVREILPLINEKGLTYKQTAIAIGKSYPTIKRWVRLLRDHGYQDNTVNKRRGLEI